MAKNKALHVRNTIPPLGELADLAVALSSKTDLEILLLGGSLLDVALEKAIEAAFVPLEMEDKQQLFNGQQGGPLATFSAKVLVGYAARVVTPNMREDLRRIAQLRNAFAHTLSTLDLPVFKDHLTFAVPQNFEAELDQIGGGSTRETINPEAAIVQEKRSPIPAGDYHILVDNEGNVAAYIPDHRSGDAPRDLLVEAIQMNWFLLVARGATKF